MREARIDESVCAIDYRWPMGGTVDPRSRSLEPTQIPRRARCNYCSTMTALELAMPMIAATHPPSSTATLLDTSWQSLTECPYCPGFTNALHNRDSTAAHEN
jgi:hypothetical protein